MYRGFSIGGEWWHVNLVPPASPFLIDRTGRLTVATTDTVARRINVSNDIHGEFLQRVLAHEITHVVMDIYGMNDLVRELSMRGDYVDLEEMMCNLVADHGHDILATAHSIVNGLDTIYSAGGTIAA